MWHKRGEERHEQEFEKKVLEELAHLTEEIEELEDESHPRKLARITIIIEQGVLMLNVGDKRHLTVTGFAADGTSVTIDFAANPVTWVMTDPALSLTPNADGSADLAAVTETAGATVTAQCAGFSDSVSVPVAAPTKSLASIKIASDQPF